MEQNVIRVQFFKPVDGKTEYYFGSISAIYERFSAEQIGCPIQSFWTQKLTQEKPKATDKCIVTKHSIMRKPQSKK